MSSSNEFKDFVSTRVSLASRMLILAEECTELAQAALKFSRSLGLFPDNPTPRTPEDAYDDMCEEADDVLMCMDLLHLLKTEDTSTNPKWKRWAERLGYKEDKENG